MTVTKSNVKSLRVKQEQGRTELTHQEAKVWPVVDKVAVCVNRVRLREVLVDQRSNRIHLMLTSIRLYRVFCFRRRLRTNHLVQQ